MIKTPGMMCMLGKMAGKVRFVGADTFLMPDAADGRVRFQASDRQERTDSGAESRS
ncbi:MAG: hypothetical protein MZU97_05090 [Bacillus subtilis]|nr:hypothetical protein [Bacillus subtilis]